MRETLSDEFVAWGGKLWGVSQDNKSLWITRLTMSRYYMLSILLQLTKNGYNGEKRPVLRNIQRPTIELCPTVTGDHHRTMSDR